MERTMCPPCGRQVAVRHPDAESEMDGKKIIAKKLAICKTAKKRAKNKLRKSLQFSKQQKNAHKINAN